VIDTLSRQQVLNAMGPLRERATYPRHDSRARGAVEPPAHPLPGSEPIDRAHLSRYTLGSPTLEREILGLFLAQLPLSIEQLRFAATDREWQIAAHTIKGSARAVGAWRIAALAKEAEQSSGIDDEEERDRILAALEAAGETVESYVAATFPATPPRA
jgi:HPt (histidine-containing phosphotransfer) domain-containing protein